MACTGSATARSQLLQFRYTPANKDFFALEAQYLLDRLDGDPDQTPEVPDSCAVVTQRYEFWREGYDAPEASDELSAARFKPIVRYQYFTDPSGPVLKSFNTAQRFLFTPTAFSETSPPSFTFPPSPADIAALFLDCEFPFDLGCFGATNNYLHQNPLQNEVAIRVIQDGQVASPLNPLPFLGPYGSGVLSVQRADNLHYRSLAGTPAIAGPTLTGHPGCPECVHMHWRWGGVLERDKAIGAVAISPRFDNNGGRPIIPPGSHQDVDIGILVPDSNEEHPASPKTYLDYATHAPISGSIQVPLSVWYSAIGHANQDLFMQHGGFFSSLKVSISNPYILTNNAIFLMPLQSFLGCPDTTQQSGMCPIYTDIQNRTGHSVTWTATLLDKSTGAILAAPPPEKIAGVPGQEILGKATLYFPPIFQLFPTYILDIKVVDDVTGWSTERQAYVTPSGAGSPTNPGP
jgi:hypothetical protein